jgi:hypothetical protein
MRGYQNCELCNEAYPIKVTVDGVTKPVGNAETRVRGTERSYASPNMIPHYVVRHRYKPPQEFIDAVMTDPLGEPHLQGST